MSTNLGQAAQTLPLHVPDDGLPRTNELLRDLKYTSKKKWEDIWRSKENDRLDSGGERRYRVSTSLVAVRLAWPWRIRLQPHAYAHVSIRCSVTHSHATMNSGRDQCSNYYARDHRQIRLFLRVDDQCSMSPVRIIVSHCSFNIRILNVSVWNDRTHA